METDLNYSDPHLVAMHLLGILNEVASTAKRLDLKGDVKYYFEGVNSDQWDAGLNNLKEACFYNGYSINAHIVEVKEGFNVYLLLN